MNFLGKNIRWLRKRSSQRQDDIALLVHKGQTTIGNWENGVSEPGLEDLLTLSNYFGIPVDILLKVDIALSGPSPSPSGSPGTGKEQPVAPGGTPFIYDSEDQAVSMVREPDEDKLYPILEEIRTIREEIERLKSRLPGIE